MGVKRLERQLIMQRSRRAIIYAVVTGLLTAGAVTATMQAATANVAGFCDASGAKASCTDTHTITGPDTVTVGATANPNQSATVAWKATCSLGAQTATTSGGSDSKTPVSDPLTLPFADPDSCTVSATVTLSGTGSLSVAMTYTTPASPSPSPSPTPPPVHLVKGYGGKCLDDAGNSSANRARVVIWTCSGHDQAQSWTYRGHELIHNGKCLNDQRSGGNGSKVILYTCNGAANEIWTHMANGEFVLKARNGKLCLDDPASSTRNGTQLIVYKCSDAANQRWQLP
jgi:hypothetical protein